MGKCLGPPGGNPWHSCPPRTLAARRPGAHLQEGGAVQGGSRSPRSESMARRTVPAQATTPQQIHREEG